MEKMKNSGIEWIGDIPEGWEVKPIRILFDEITEKNLYGKEKNALQYKMGTIVRKKNFDSDTDNYVADTVLNYTIVDPGTIVLNGLNLNYDFVSKRVAIVKERGIITSAYITFKSKSENTVSSDFANYLLKSYDAVKAFHNMGGGVRKILNFTELKHKYIPLPPPETQKRIADFLDAKCVKIDGLKNDIQKQIETLEQYKKSVITEAVTKGINPNAKMKDSGIEWIGEIPEHWEIHPIYYYFEERKHKNSLCKEQNLLSLSYGNIIRKDINALGGLLPESFNTYNIIEKDDIVIRPTDLQNDKRSLRTGLCKEHGIITSAYITLIPKKKVNSKYFHYLLHSYDIEKVFYNMGNGVRQGLNYSEFAKLLVISPTKDEQKDIVAYLDKKCSSIDSIISTKKQQLEKLEEYKKSLIFEYVTGKREVSGGFSSKTSEKKGI